MKRSFLALVLAICIVSTSLMAGCGTSVAESSAVEQSMSDWGTAATEQMSVAENMDSEISSEVEEGMAIAEDTELETTDESFPESVVEENSVENAGEEASMEAPEIMAVDEMVEESTLTDIQKNSFAMLYYLAITAEEIRSSKDNRLLLEEINTSLINDLDPDAVDEITQDHLQNLRDIIGKYIDTSIKRDRLIYIYNQNKATAIRSAVPNPLAVMSVTNALDWKKLAVSVVYTVVDSYSSYKDATQSADQQYLFSGWELDDEERETVRKNRDRAFNYMVDIVQEYGLDGKLTLSEQDIQDFVEICAIESVYLRLERLESEKNTYVMLGNYWLELADCYYEISEYQKCLDSVAEYKNLATGIYRKDFNYVQILPKAVVAAQELYEGEEYITTLSGFADEIIENTKTNEWSTRYFAAQVYLDLYSRTEDSEYLNKAYDIALDNVTMLLSEQRNINETYMAEVREVKLEEKDDKYMTNKEKKELKKEQKAEQDKIDAYNKELKQKRETELPSLYEPLVLNCELLFALAEKIGIDKAEQIKIQGILETEENGIFVSKPVNSEYSFENADEDYAVEFDGAKLVIPANLLVEGAKIVVTVKGSGGENTFTDWTLSKVKREGEDITSFYAHYESKEIGKFKWEQDSKITIEISIGENFAPVILNYKVAEYKDNFLVADKVVFVAE